MRCFLTFLPPQKHEFLTNVFTARRVCELLEQSFFLEILEIISIGLILVRSEFRDQKPNRKIRVLSCFLFLEPRPSRGLKTTSRRPLHWTVIQHYFTPHFYWVTLRLESVRERKREKRDREKERKKRKREKEEK